VRLVLQGEERANQVESANHDRKAMKRLPVGEVLLIRCPREEWSIQSTMTCEVTCFGFVRPSPKLY